MADSPKITKVYFLNDVHVYPPDGHNEIQKMITSDMAEKPGAKHPQRGGYLIVQDGPFIVFRHVDNKAKVVKVPFANVASIEVEGL